MRKIARTRNKFETKLSEQLIKAKVKFKYEAERIPYVLARHYIPDFILETIHGKIYIEAKGHFRPEAKAKMKAVKRQNPNMDIRFVFYKYSKVYERWCIKHNFKYAFNDIPNEWLEE